MAPSRSLDVEQLWATVASGRFEWRQHALQRLAERGIPQSAVLDVLRSGEMIEHYAEALPYPSGLFLARVDGRPVHVVAALDAEHDWVYIITAYEPDLDHFEPDWRTRRP